MNAPLNPAERFAIAKVAYSDACAEWLRDPSPEARQRCRDALAEFNVAHEGLKREAERGGAQ